MAEAFVNIFIALLVVVDPIGLAPIFAGLTQGMPRKKVRLIARRATLIGGGILAGFTLGGNGFLELVGIGIPAFRIAGGILLFLTALDMIFVRPSGARGRTVSDSIEDKSSHQETEGYEIAVFPLAIPLIAGPGAITTVLLFSGEAVSRSQGAVLVLIAVAAVLSLTYLVLFFTSNIMKVMGKTGAGVVARVFGVLLAALAVQLVLDGIEAVL